jgi:hypothetical protein
MRTGSGLLVAATLILAGTAASTAHADEHRVETTRGGYLVDFDDDPLGATGHAASGWQLQVRTRKPRVLLIRPRTTFVPELRKSAENL